MTTMFRTGYFDNALDAEGLTAVIERAQRDLAEVDFDTLVGTGFSGGVVIPALALAMGKHFVLIRKENDDSHHGPGRLIGTLGDRWIFFDDFISVGRTRRRAISKIAAACVVEDTTSTCVGQYMYRGPAFFAPFDPAWAEEGPQ